MGVGSGVVMLVASASIAGLLYLTEFVKSTELSRQLSASVPTFFCHKPVHDSEGFTFSSVAESYEIFIVGVIAFALLSNRVAKRLPSYASGPVRACSNAIIIFTIVGVACGIFRYSNNPETKAQCATISARIQNAVKTDARDLITPFLEPLQFLPPKISVLDSNVAHTYAILYPHIAEYLLTVEPYLMFIYAFLGLILEIRPIKNWVWQNLIVVNALASLGISILSERSDFVHAEQYDIVLNFALQYAVFYALTFILVPLVDILFWLGMRRISFVSACLLIMRLKTLDILDYGFKFDTVLAVIFIALLYTFCEFSAGIFVHFALLAYSFGWSTLEWGLVALLIDNAVLQILPPQIKEKQQQQHGKQQRKKKKE